LKFKKSFFILLNFSEVTPKKIRVYDQGKSENILVNIAVRCTFETTWYYYPRGK